MTTGYFVLATGHLDVRDGLCGEQRLVGLDMVEDRDGHAPRTLARDTPIAAALGHGGDAVATHLGDPRHLTEKGVAQW